MWGLWLAASAALAQDASIVCTPDLPVLAVPPVTVSCVAEIDPELAYEELAWRFGDGTTDSGPAVSHTFEAPGQYDLTLTVRGTSSAGTGADTGLSDTIEVEELSAVTTCAEPEPEFSYVFKGGLTFQMINETPLAYGCVDAVRWTVYRGTDFDGEPVLGPVDTWQPRFELPEDGTYTFLLTLGGIAGTAAAKLEVDAEYGLTEELGNIRSSPCATGGGAAGGVVPVLLALIGLRRRR